MRRRSAAYWPFSFVVTLTGWLVPRFVTVTCAPEPRAPAGSVTSPIMPPRSTCANNRLEFVRSQQENRRMTARDNRKPARIAPPGCRYTGVIQRYGRQLLHSPIQPVKTSAVTRGHTFSNASYQNCPATAHHYFF